MRWLWIIFLFIILIFLVLGRIIQLDAFIASIIGFIIGRVIQIKVKHG